MTNTIIIYHSKTGFSQRYAQWLAEDLGCRAAPFRERGGVRLAEYGTVVLVGGLYAGQMSGLGWLKKQLPGLKGVRAAAVAVGCAPMENPGLQESMDRLLGDTEGLRGFYCQGGLDYGRMGVVDRAMMAALRAMLRRQKGSEAMLEGVSRSFDGTNRAYLEPVIRWARGEM